MINSVAVRVQASSTQNLITFISGVKKSASAFDIDNTVNRGRNRIIAEEICASLLKLLSLGKRIYFVSGKSIEEIIEYNMFFPLLDLLTRSGISLASVVIYTSDGAGKFTFNERREPIMDLSYSLPFTAAEAIALAEAIAEVSQELERRYSLSSQGIGPFVRNFGNLKYNYSPYGNMDKNQYSFESDPQIAASYVPARLTRAQVAQMVMDLSLIHI